MPQDDVGETVEGVRRHVPEGRQRRVQDRTNRHRRLPARRHPVHAGVHLHRRSEVRAVLRVGGSSQGRRQVRRRRDGGQV